MAIAANPTAPAQIRFAILVSDNYFPVMGVTPAAGRVFLPEEATVSAEYPATALDDLLGIEEGKINDTRLYRCLDRILPHKTELEQHLKQRYGELFGASLTFCFTICHALPRRCAGTGQPHRSHSECRWRSRSGFQPPYAPGGVFRRSRCGIAESAAELDSQP